MALWGWWAAAGPVASGGAVGEGGDRAQVDLGSACAGGVVDQPGHRLPAGAAEFPHRGPHGGLVDAAASGEVAEDRADAGAADTVGLSVGCGDGECGVDGEGDGEGVLLGEDLIAVFAKWNINAPSWIWQGEISRVRQGPADAAR